MDGEAHISNSDRPWLASYPDFADWAMSIGSEPAYAAMERSIAAYPEKICMEFLGRTWTYRETGEMIRSAAKGLQDLGVGKGDRVALMLPNTPYYIVMFHATLLIGGIVGFPATYVGDHGLGCHVSEGP